jgi:hypothetical protein
MQEHQPGHPSAEVHQLNMPVVSTINWRSCCRSTGVVQIGDEPLGPRISGNVIGHR